MLVIMMMTNVANDIIKSGFNDCISNENET